MHSEEKVGEYEYYATEPVHISQYKVEFTELLKLFKLLEPVSVLELGTHYGGTLYQWLQHMKPGGKVVAVDDHHLNSEVYTNWVNGQEIYPIKGVSQHANIIDAVRDNGPYDFIFIDASHLYADVKMDWEEYGTMTRKNKNSLIAFHDIVPHPNTEVDKLWREIKDRYTHWEFITDKEQEGCGIGVVLIEPS